MEDETEKGLDESRNGRRVDVLPDRLMFAFGFHSPSPFGETWGCDASPDRLVSACGCPLAEPFWGVVWSVLL
jgi:hypothetical protein